MIIVLKIIVSFFIDNFNISFYFDFRDLENTKDLNYIKSQDYNDKINIDLINIEKYHISSLKLGEVITELKEL
ncbi:MAG: hypothetical protein KatS3mg068_0576 [Candidatus Sericytochromatia bacterium]|nr:MAG: hypothetical protein KatS3mg068_0576 [Candidatus Sericytochromatia bacterium]